MGGRRHDDEQRSGEAVPGEAARAVPAIVEAQLEAARAEVFRAYVRARDKAQQLAQAELDEARTPPRRAPRPPGAR